MKKKKVWNLYCEVHYEEDLFPHDEHCGTFYGTKEEVKAYVDAENHITCVYDNRSSYGMVSYREANEVKAVPTPRKVEDVIVRINGSWRKQYRMRASDDYGWYVHIYNQAVGDNHKADIDMNEVKYDNRFKDEPEVIFYLRGIEGETHEEFIARAKARTEELLPAPAGKRLGEPEE